ncbi:MAG: sigma 54-interacting transcriptional regulator [Myxococcales bacterium]|nr:sigma 54-interacting transcriptional regulator [Myxococcales bacterium]
MQEELEDAGLRPHFVHDEEEAVMVARASSPELVLVDGSLTRGGSESLQQIFAAAPGALRVVLLPATTGAWVSTAHRSGADAILPLPLQRASVGKLLVDLGERRAETSSEWVELPELVDRSDRMRDVWRLVALASRGDASVLVSGETGAGKEAVARALHRFSPRRHGPFVAINCAALPETLLESELFGHEKGAFTGAAGQHKGRFELADGGTLFLDEIGDLPLSLQVKLLRILQEQRFERLGGSKTISVDVRIVSATHRDLEEEVRRGRFRADLYYRIRVLLIRVAPLHLRKEDILPLWDHFLSEGAEREGRPPPETSMAARRRLLRHRWPGNVRELHNASAHALMLAGSRTIQPADLPETLLEHHAGDSGASLVGMTLKDIERAAILETYAALGTVKAAADALGVSPRKIHYRLKEYREDGVPEARLRGPEHREPAGDGPEPELDSPPRILLAEDDDELRWSLHDFLRCSGYQVVAVRDGHALLEHLGAAVFLEQRDSPPDAIITDMRMPFMTGLQILQKVREREWSTPVVMISAFGDRELRRRATELGAVAFLDKPIDTDALLRVLHEVVGK